MFSLESVSDKNLSFLHFNHVVCGHKNTRRTDLLLFQGGYGAAGGSQATVGNGGCGSGGDKYYYFYHFWYFVTLSLLTHKAKDYHLGFVS